MRVRRLFPALLAAALAGAVSPPASYAAAVAGPEERGADGVDAMRFRIGPLFEYRRDASGGVFWAFRPFYSQAQDPKSDTAVRDVIWPLGTFHRRHSASWWRALNAFGDSRRDDPSWSFNFFPVWFNGCDRAGRSYWGAFPLYGRHPHLLFMDDVRFLLFPFHLDYKIRGVRRDYIFWPLLSFEQDEADSAGFWPFYGSDRLRESTHSYALWPFVTWASYDEDRDTSGAGSSWMFWPFYGTVNRARESQTLVLPPLFSSARTDRASRLRAPWPFFERFQSDYKNSLTVWPLYSSQEEFPFHRKGEAPQPQAKSRSWGWWLVVDSHVETEKLREDRFRVFPFWTDETLSRRGPDGEFRVVNSYRRFWPFWSSERDGGRARQRALELNPIRHAGGIERNWAPFWTFWTREEAGDGSALHTFFWGLIKFRTGRPSTEQP